VCQILITQRKGERDGERERERENKRDGERERTREMEREGEGERKTEGKGRESVRLEREEGGDQFLISSQA
jgi:hypothetical protein